MATQVSTNPAASWSSSRNARINDRLIIGAVDRLVEPLVGIDEGDLVGGHGGRADRGAALGPDRCTLAERGEFSPVPMRGL